MNCGAASLPALPLLWSMSVSLKSSRRFRVTCPAPLTSHLPICRAEPGNLPPADRRSCLSAKPTAGLRKQRRTYLRLAYGMLPFFVAGQTGDNNKGSPSNNSRPCELTKRKQRRRPPYFARRHWVKIGNIAGLLKKFRVA